MTALTQTEQEKMRRVPGIVFADGQAGRRARIEGTGVDVFEVIGAFHEFGDDRAVLIDVCDWLTPQQIDAARTFYRCYPDEIDEILRRQDAIKAR